MAIRVAAATLCLLVHGCDTVRGGAVELSWKLRPASSEVTDKFVDCTSGKPGTGRVDRIRLNWQLANGTDAGSQDWNCDDNQGVTRFDVPIGTVDLSITPECDGTLAAPAMVADPATYIAPPILQRDVGLGDTVSLGALELIVTVSNCQTDMSLTGKDVPTQPCICCTSTACLQ